MRLDIKFGCFGVFFKMVMAVECLWRFSAVTVQVASLPDGRELGYCIVGKGQPVLYFHGTASSRLEVLLLKDVADSAGLQIVGVDRPGYGLSSYHKRRNLCDFNADVNFLADALGFGRFSVLGWSGGGAFALAYLAGHPERVSKAVLADAPALPFDVSMAHNFPFSKYALKIPFAGNIAIGQLRRTVLKANGDVPSFLKSKEAKQILRGYTPSDLQLFSNPAWAQLMYQSMAEAFRQNTGVKAVVEEHMLFLKNWGFSTQNIPAGKLEIWHGKDDKTIPVRNGYLLSEMVKGSKLEIFAGKGHCAMFNYQDKLGKALLE
jgi:pimeloyl-ACP methyl ester carboxylesterase